MKSAKITLEFEFDCQDPERAKDVTNALTETVEMLTGKKPRVITEQKD